MKETGPCLHYHILITDSQAQIHKEQRLRTTSNPETTPEYRVRTSFRAEVRSIPLCHLQPRHHVFARRCGECGDIDCGTGHFPGLSPGCCFASGFRPTFSFIFRLDLAFTQSRFCSGSISELYSVRDSAVCRKRSRLVPDMQLCEALTPVLSSSSLLSTTTDCPVLSRHQNRNCL